MRTWLACLALVISLVGWIQIAAAAPTVTACSALADAQRKLAQDIFQSQHAYECCDGTLSQCLQKKPLCKLVRRLTEDICRRVAAGQRRTDIERELARRAMSMMPTATVYQIDTRNSPIGGSPDAKVTLVAYLCPRCPYCARLEPELYQSVTSGNLKGKVKLYVRTFPVRSHAGSTEAGLALIAAAKLGKFWEFMQHLYQDFHNFDAAHLDDIAAAVGLDRKKFSEAAQDPGTRQQLVDSKKEGVKNGVDATPTLFINGRKYTGDMKMGALEDVLEEEHERVTGQQHD
jgi:protein-disulfide isomerase